MTKPTGKPRGRPKVGAGHGRPRSATKRKIQRAVEATAVDVAVQAFVAARHSSDKQPLDIILDVARGASEREITNRQLQAAIAAAPYVHARLNAVAVRDVTPASGDVAKRQQMRRQMLEALLGLARPEPLSAEELARHRDVIEGAISRPEGE